MSATDNLHDFQSELLRSPVISATDPGAIGAGRLWMRVATGGGGIRGYVDGYGCALYVRKADDSGWNPVATVVYDGDGKMRGFFTAGQDGTICIETFDGAEASQGTLFLNNNLSFFGAGHNLIFSGGVLTIDGNALAMAAALPTYQAVADAAARHELTGLVAGALVAQLDTFHRWVAVDLTKLASDSGWQDLGLYHTGPQIYSGGTFPLNLSVVTYSGGILQPDGNDLYLDRTATDFNDHGANGDGVFDFSGIAALVNLTIQSNATPQPPVVADLASLATFEWDNSPATTPPDFTGCTQLAQITIAATGITSVPYVLPLTALQQMTLSGNTSLADGTAMASLPASLTTLLIVGSTALTTFGISSWPAGLTYINFYGCGLNNTCIGDLLNALVGLGASNGYLNISGGGNHTVEDYATQLDTLAGRGWTLITN